MTQQSMAKTLSFGVSGVNGFPVQVEVFCVDGMPMMEIIGLPDTSVRESKNRINAAILSSGIELPVSRVTFNLAPADIRKEGPSFDLPMAVGLLIASNRLSLRDEYDPDHTAFFGELGLDGCVRRVNGVLPMVISAKENGIREVILPSENAREAACIEGLRIIPVSHLYEAIFPDAKVPLPPMSHLLPEDVILYRNDIPAHFGERTSETDDR